MTISRANYANSIKKFPMSLSACLLQVEKECKFKWFLSPQL